MIFLFPLMINTPSVIFAQNQIHDQQRQTVARVYDTMIDAASIEPAIGLKESKMAELKDDRRYRQWYHNYRRMLLSRIVANELKKAFLKEYGLESTEQEVASYMRFQNEWDEYQFDDLLHQREAAMYRLQNEQLTPQELTLHKQYLAAADVLIEKELKKRKILLTDAQAQQERERQLKAQAYQGVLWWKFHKRLFEQYGGRVIVQTRGWEALDAYQMFLQEHEQKKTFEVLDANLLPLFIDFQEYYRENHKVVDMEQASMYFTSPWWEEGGVYSPIIRGYMGEKDAQRQLENAL
jgi:hypothetical protein